MFDLNDIDSNQQIQLCFNIFPKCNTIMHKIAMSSSNKSDNNETSNSSSSVTKKLFTVCNNEGLKEATQDYPEAQTFEVPILENARGHTVLDIALANHELRKIDLTEVVSKLYEVIFNTKPSTIFKNNKKEKKNK